MRKKHIKAPDVYAVRHEAGEILGTGANRLYLIAGIAIVLALLSVYTILFSVRSILETILVPYTGAWIGHLLIAVYWILMTLFSIFFSVPLLLGFLRMAFDAEDHGNTALAELFYAFTDAKTYRRMLRLSFGFTLGTAVLSVAIWGTCRLTLLGFSGSLTAGLLCGVAVLLEVAIAVAIFLRSFPYLAVVMDERIPMRDARRIARATVSRMPASGFLFFLSFIPMILLGLLTIGILLIADTIPRMAVSYFRYCRSMNELIIRSEEYKKHE